jgi:Ni,Fe-hydrogenase III small subunit
MVSLGIKNLKGTIDIRSRKKCHNPLPGMDLHRMVSKLLFPMPPMFTLIDGIYSQERGPNVDGQARRSNLLVASLDVLSADRVGAKVLGFEPADVPYLVHAAQALNRPVDLSDVEVVGEKIENVASPHDWIFPYTEDGALPAAMEKMGIKGLSYPKYDWTICTYCAGLTRVMLIALARAWKGTPFDDVEILTGKLMQASPGKKKTLLLGKCIYEANRNNSNIQEMIAIKGCPPSHKAIFKGLRQAGVEADPDLFEHMDRVMGIHMKRYRGKPEFEESFYQVAES